MIDKRNARKMLIQVDKTRRSLLQPCFARIGLAFGQGHARILESLLTEDHITQKELAERCQVDVTTMSRSLDKLQKSTGLDLRVFEDAITFKIALMVVKYMKYMETLDY